MGMGGNSNGGLNAAAAAANPAAGGDIYTVLANMQRNSLSAQQQQQRNSPQPGANMVRPAVCLLLTMLHQQQWTLITPNKSQQLCSEARHLLFLSSN